MESQLGHLTPSLVLVVVVAVGERAMAGRVIRRCPCWVSLMCRSVTITALLLNFSVRANGMVNGNIVCVLLFVSARRLIVSACVGLLRIQAT